MPKKHSAVNEISFIKNHCVATTTLFVTQDCKTDNLTVIIKGQFKANTELSGFELAGPDRADLASIIHFIDHNPTP